MRGTEDDAWLQAHEALSRLAKARALADAEEGRWLLAAVRSAAHVHLGFGSFGEYIERLFGYGRRCTQEKLRVAEALEGLPELERALETGELSWSAVRELTRVAVPETEGAWLTVSRGKSVRQLEELVSGKSIGDGPFAPSEPSARRHVLRFEVEAETLAMFRQAVGELRRRSGSALSDDAVLLEMARQVLGGPDDEGRASYQIAVTVCAECGRGTQEAGGELVTVDPEVVAMASCDGQDLGRVDAQPANDAVRAESDAAAREETDAERIRAHVGAGACPENHPGARVSVRAKQCVPPAVRRAVLRRDHHCCRVPGCRNSRFLDVHHIELRSEGGNHRAENLLTVCGAHHRALHRGELCVGRSGAMDVRFTHADGTPYGEVAELRSLDMLAKVFGALQNFGFREGEVRAVLSELRGQEELRDADAQSWLRAALQRLTKPAKRRSGWDEASQFP